MKFQKNKYYFKHTEIKEKDYKNVYLTFIDIKEVILEVYIVTYKLSMDVIFRKETICEEVSLASLTETLSIMLKSRDQISEKEYVEIKKHIHRRKK